MAGWWAVQVRRAKRSDSAVADLLRGDVLSVGLRHPVAVHAAIVEGRAGHARLYHRHHPPRPDHRAGDRSRSAVEVEAAEYSFGGVHRGIPLHTAAGADRVVLLCAAGAAGDPDTG